MPSARVLHGKTTNKTRCRVLGTEPNFRRLLRVADPEISLRIAKCKLQISNCKIFHIRHFEVCIFHFAIGVFACSLMQRRRKRMSCAASSFVVMLKGNKTVVRRNCEISKSIVTVGDGASGRTASF
jgi:hypothetical protein